MPGQPDGSLERANTSIKHCEIKHKPSPLLKEASGCSVACEKYRNTEQNCETIRKWLSPCAPIHNRESRFQRLNKAIAASGYCSRRRADALIKAGKIKVNGLACDDLARRVGPADEITIDGKRISARGGNIYLLLNKPVGVVSTAKDPQKRKTVLDLLPDKYRRLRPFPVGRLDYFSEGLLILTNDGDFANRLMHPRFHLAKEYEVIVRGVTSEKILSDFRSGMILADGQKLMPVKARAERLPDGNTRFRLELRQGINRQIRRMCEKHGLVILKLRRIRQGSLELGDLPPGKLRALTPAEISNLMAQSS